jgi:ketosteroid isomerase-like protein
MAGRKHSDVVRAFFAAMNAQDADAAAALVTDDVAIDLGPHRLAGRSAVRDLALQADDQLAFETVPIDLDATSDTVIAARAVRTQRWRSTGEVAAEEELHAHFTFDGDGTISRIVLA